MLSEGANYGWVYLGLTAYVGDSCQIILGPPSLNQNRALAEAPLYDFRVPDRPPNKAPTVAPAGMTYVPAETFPGIGGGLALCLFNTQWVVLYELNEAGDEVVGEHLLGQGCAVAVAYDEATNSVYYSAVDGVHRIAAAPSQD